MSRNKLPEEPMLFDETDDADSSALSVELLKETEEIKRKSKTLEFCLSSAKWIAPIAVLLIIFDILLQHWQMDSTLLKDCFSLLTYVVTAALGFIFANNSK